MVDFSNKFCLEHLMNEPTCLKSANSSCIEKSLFMRSRTFEGGLPDFHKVATTVVRKSSRKDNPKTILNGGNKSFDQNKFNPFFPNAPFPFVPMHPFSKVFSFQN